MIEKRFWDKVQKTPTCWLWTGSINVYGYGRFWLPEKQMTYPAHRFIFESISGMVFKDLDIHHICEVKHCVNPDHLTVLTKADNVRSSGNTKKTCCPRGHEYSGNNLIIYRGRGWVERQCRICHYQRMRRKRSGLPRTKRATYRGCGVPAENS